MAQVIIIAKEYQCRPSQIMGIDNKYEAYCFDEVALYLTSMAMGKDGKVNWNKIKWKSTEKKTNKDLVEFIKAH